MDGDLVKLSVNQERQLEVRKLASEATITSARNEPSVDVSTRTVLGSHFRQSDDDEQSSSERCLSDLEPWGSPPTPLLPRWYLDIYGEVELPVAFTDVYPQIRCLNDLRNFWEHYEGPLNRNAVSALRGLADQLRPPRHMSVLGSDIGLTELNRLPLHNRTRNCVSRGLNSGSLVNGSVGELMRLSSFGIASLLDLMCVLEASEDFSEFIKKANDSEMKESDTGSFTEPPQTPENPSRRSVVVPGTGVMVNAARLLSEILPRWSLAIRSTALICDEAELVVAAARELRGAKSLGDLLRLDLADLVAAAAVDSALAEIPLEDDNPSLAERAVEAIEVCLGRMSDTERLLATQRVAASEPKSRKEIAAMAGVSRERIRQLDERVRSALHTAAGSILGLLSLAVTDRLGYVTTRPEIENAVVEFLPSSNCNSDAAHSLTVARRLLQDRLGYKCRNELCLSREAAQAAETLRQSAPQLVDDTGLLDSEQLRQALAPEFQDEIEILVHWLGWHKLLEHIALRVTARARTKAALLKIGKPATKAELAAESGLTEQQVGGALSSIESVARATKDRWGLREWIDDVYEGIPAEIIQRINEDGGSTRLNRVLDELPRLFNVSESSVKAFMATPQFVIENERIRLRREDEEYNHQRLEVRDAPGVFALDDGVVGLLYEVDHDVTRGSGRQLSPVAGLLLDLSINDRLRFDGPIGTAVTVTFPDTSVSGPSLGSTRGLVKATNAKIGDMLTVILCRAEMTVSAQATTLDEHDTGWALVARLTGISENAGIDGLADALQCSRGEVRAILRARRDEAVLRALPERCSTPDLEAAFTALDVEMQR